MENVWIKNSEIVWVDDAFPDDIMEILVDEDFDGESMELKLDPLDDSMLKILMTKITITFSLYMLYSLIIKNMKSNSWKLRKCFATLSSLKSLLEIEGFGIAKPLTVSRK